MLWPIVAFAAALLSLIGLVVALMWRYAIGMTAAVKDDPAPREDSP